MSMSMVFMFGFFGSVSPTRFVRQHITPIPPHQLKPPHVRPRTYSSLTLTRIIIQSKHAMITLPDPRIRYHDIDVFLRGDGDGMFEEGELRVPGGDVGAVEGVAVGRRCYTISKLQEWDGWGKGETDCLCPDRCFSSSTVFGPAFSSRSPITIQALTIQSLVS